MQGIHFFSTLKSRPVGSGKSRRFSHCRLGFFGGSAAGADMQTKLNAIVLRGQKIRPFLEEKKWTNIFVTELRSDLAGAALRAGERNTSRNCAKCLFCVLIVIFCEKVTKCARKVRATFFAGAAPAESRDHQYSTFVDTEEECDLYATNRNICSISGGESEA